MRLSDDADGVDVHRRMKLRAVMHFVRSLEKTLPAKLGNEVAVVSLEDPSRADLEHGHALEKNHAVYLHDIHAKGSHFVENDDLRAVLTR